MTIGEVIRKYRKQKGMTQEEMATILGVTTPAVNKWERGNTMPDVALLAPIARLLSISTDELLSYKDNLTDEEINQYLHIVQEDLKNKDFHDVFLSVKKKIEEFPNSEKLIWQAAIILDSKLMVSDIRDKDNYENTILKWYERCLGSEDERIRKEAADSLFHAYIRNENYDKAAHYLEYFSFDNPERKRKKALINSKTGKRTEAYRSYEELLYTGYQQMQLVLNDLRLLYMEDDDYEMAKKLVEVSSSIASAFEMGKYNEVCIALDVAAWKKDVEWTAHIMREILESVDTISDFAYSKLYRHMKLKSVAPSFIAEVKKELLKSLNDETFDYMNGNEEWEKLKKDTYEKE